MKSACEKNAGAFGRLVRRRRQAGASAPSESEQSRRDHQNKASDLFGGFVLVKSACEKNAGAFGRLVRRRRIIL